MVMLNGAYLFHFMLFNLFFSLCLSLSHTCSDQFSEFAKALFFNLLHWKWDFVVSARIKKKYIRQINTIYAVYRRFVPFGCLLYYLCSDQTERDAIYRFISHSYHCSEHKLFILQIKVEGKLNEKKKHTIRANIARYWLDWEKGVRSTSITKILFHIIYTITLAF